MADVTLTSLAAGTPVQGVQSGSAPLTATGGGVPSVLASLPPGTLIQGFVLNRDAQSNPILRTDSGDFLIQSDLFLKIGSDVVVQLNGTGNNVRASILSVDGHSPQAAENTPAHSNVASVIVRSDANAAGTQARSPQNPTTQQAAATTPPPAVLRQSVNLTGTLVRPALPGPPSAGTTTFAQQQQIAAATPFTVGTRLLFQLVNVSPPQTQQPQSPPGTPAASFTLNVTGAETPPSAQPPTAPATGTTSLPPQQQPAAPAVAQYSAYTRYAATPPAAAGASPPPVAQTAAPTAGNTTPQAPQLLQAEVIVSPSSADNAGPPVTVVQTPLGTVHLDSTLPMPVGSRLTLQVLQTAPPAADNSNVQSSTALPSTVVSLADNWQSLNQIINTLTQIDPNTAARFMRLALPVVAYGAIPMAENLYPSAQTLGTGMLFFLTALSGGDFRSWLGDHAATLLDDRGHAELLNKAEGEFALMRSLYSDASPQQWQALFLPVMAEGDLKTLRFFTKRDRKPKERGRPQQADTRFIVEMELSQTGQLQLDGLVRKRDNKTQFDLMIRSREPFSEQAQRDILSIYNSIGEATGYSGGVLFQQTNEFSVRPLEEILASRHREVTA